MGVAVNVLTAPFRPIAQAQTYRTLVFLAAAVPVGAAALALLIAGWTATAVLLVTPLVVVALIAFRGAVGLLSSADAALARTLLGAEVSPRLSSGGTGFWARGRAVAADGDFWRQQAYLAVRLTVGFAVAVAQFTLIASALGCLAFPIWYRWSQLRFGSWHVDTFQRSWVLVPCGIVGVALALQLTRVLRAMSVGLAEALLGNDEARVRVSPAARARALGAHLGVATAVAALTVVVWALTAHGSFWPAWVIAPLALLVVVHWWVDRNLGDGLAIHAGIATAVIAFLVVVWALAGSATFWPEWVILAAVLTVGAHAAFGTMAGRRGLAKRIGVLESTRAGAVDAQEAKLRKIERDLHDGAQARLVSLGISLGLAESKFGSDPDEAQALVTEARQGVQEALGELRDLVRGIHPPVLTDRGLAAALGTLADRSPVPASVHVELDERPPVAVESAAYFIVAEALANAGKHAGASRVGVHVYRRDALLLVDVEDDGHGGADPSGGGLSGLRQRLEALDGTLLVVSPAGGPTLVHGELPCAS
jgi:signal transduction histidine kinase